MISTRIFSPCGLCGQPVTSDTDTRVGKDGHLYHVACFRFVATPPQLLPPPTPAPTFKPGYETPAQLTEDRVRAIIQEELAKVRLVARA